MPPSSEQYAQLAAMFTTSEHDGISTSIELLLPAHLPVQGGLWLVPYAGREAADGVVVLIRMHEETVDVAVLGKGDVTLDGCTSMEEALERITIPNVHWIVQPPTDADPASLLHCDADRVTLLSGADQAAVVGAYRLLKGLISTSGGTSELPNIQLVIVGAEERAATDAASRIIQTAHHQLDVHIEVGPALPAMNSSTKVVSQVSFPRSSNVVDLLSRIRAGEVAQEEMPTTPRFVEQEAATLEPVPKTPTVQEEPMDFEQEKTQVTGTPSSNREPSVSYASYVDGLLAITPRCPEHDHIELALDTDGCLHVLADAGDLRDASIVCAWAVRHRDLLAMACGGLEINKSSSPVSHLFANDAVSVADLHGTGVRLHLLTSVEVGGKVGLYCTPLN
jgi:hypothetical protein